MIVGRYAPSPTGALHLGNLRTALAAYCHARSAGGRFLLRIEDLDRPRVIPESEALQLSDLRELGIEWDDEPLRQSGRDSVYAECLVSLRRAGLVYPCFCSRKDIRLAASAPHREDAMLAYPRTCRGLGESEASRRIASGFQHCWRLRVPDEEVVGFDEFAGPRTFDLSREGGDFVVRRADGLFAYQLACAVDDALSGVTDVVRGDDLLDSGPRQAHVLRSLGLNPPRYAHIPLMMGPNGERLSKRHGAADSTQYRERGFDAIALRSYLAHTLGQCGLGERLTIGEIIARFRMDRIPRAPAAVDDEAMRTFLG